MIAQVIGISWTDGDRSGSYQALKFKCPGCASADKTGLHMLPVSGDSNGKPMWDYDGNDDAPTLSPSILTRTGPNESFVCHSYIRAGMIEFLADSTHELAGQTVPLPPLEDWMVKA